MFQMWEKLDTTRMKVRCFKRTGICILNGQKSIDIVMWLRLEVV